MDTAHLVFLLTSASLICQCGLQLTPEAAAAAQKVVATKLHELQLEYGAVEPGLQLLLLPSPGAAAVAMEAADAEKLVTLMCILPHGPVRMSTAVPGRV